MNTIKTPLLIISVFKNILNNKTVSAFVEFISNLENVSDLDIILKSYSDFISLLYKCQPDVNFYMYLKNLIYSDENVLSVNNTNEIVSSAKFELLLIDNLLSYDYTTIKKELSEKFSACSDLISHLPFYSVLGIIPFNIDDIINSYKTNGFGVFRRHSAFRFTQKGEILPVLNFNALTFNDLKNYEYQKEIIKKNTEAFINGKQANNILLYGDRGCGKSSTVKALINEFKDCNLKIVQVYKESFMYLSELFEQLQKQPLKFIIFADDISFDEDDKNFSSVKAVLEGSLSDKPANTIIYATTNRVHLVKESFSSREGNEVHCNDTIDETVSLSDRFGIMLTFSILTKREYLEIVDKIAADYSIEINEELHKKAEEFAALKAIRTPRTARQFIVDYIADLK